jgi:hypothetical protein
MKHLLIATAVIAASLATPVFAADVGVSVSIGQPGFYGQINIGDYPPPQVIYRQPMIIERGDMGRPPVYLRVPPGHRKHWSRYCHEYNACGERVYFVQDNWYQHEYVPRYQEQHREYRDQQGEGRRNERGDDHRGGDRGDNGKDHGDRGDHGRGNHGRD